MRSTPLILAALATFSTTLALPTPQIGGDADASYSILNNLDNGSGYSIENIENNLADDISGQPTGSDSEGGGDGGFPARRDLTLLPRQINKIVAGFGNLGDALGANGPAGEVVDLGDVVDTYGTNGQAGLGENVAEIEDPILPSTANDLTNFDQDGGLPALNDSPTQPAQPAQS